MRNCPLPAKLKLRENTENLFQNDKYYEVIEIKDILVFSLSSENDGEIFSVVHFIGMFMVGLPLRMSYI